MSTHGTARLAIVGASTRAAAGSARRAGFVPVCVDLFADTDLRAIAEVRRCPPEDYPEGLPRIVASLGAEACVYTGGLENHPQVVMELARTLPVWGSGPDQLRVRDPGLLAGSLREAGVPGLAIRTNVGCVESAGRTGMTHSADARGVDDPLRECVDMVSLADSTHPLPAKAAMSWLEKPLRGAGGVGIRRPDQDQAQPTQGCYWQEFREGNPGSALFVSADGKATLLGTTRQLVGDLWLNAGPYRYCGSVFPGPTSPLITELGRVVAERFDLRGLFGIDYVVADGVPWVTEVNPRYTASAEVIEFAAGHPTLASHAAAFGWPIAFSTAPCQLAAVGKAILFARRSFSFPEHGPWLAAPQADRDPWERPDFADVPAAGEPVEAGWPVLSFFAEADTPEGCVRRLRDIAEELNHTFFPEMP